MCANNYLGLADSKELIDAACECYRNRGFGCASVRFICGTLDIHKELEEKISAFLGTEDTILYSSCFDANGGLFETILTAEDAIISDELNHASIIDGVRLCKAVRYRYHNNDMADLEQKLIEAIDYRKDVDGFHPINVGRMDIGLPCFISATPLGIMTLLDRYNIKTSGKKCVILGRSNICLLYTSPSPRDA